MKTSTIKAKLPLARRGVFDWPIHMLAASFAAEKAAAEKENAGKALKLVRSGLRSLGSRCM